MGDRGKAVALLIAAVLVTLASLEAALRVVQWRTHGTPVLTRFPGYRPTTFQLSPFLVFGPRVNYRREGAPETPWSWFNAQGFRTAQPVGPKPVGEYRMVTLGGSTTENVLNQAGIHWPLVLECELQRAGHAGVRVLNAAMSAYTSAHSLVRLVTDIVEFEPDLVIVMHNINDLGVMYYALSSDRPFDHNYLVRYGQKGYTGQITEDEIVQSRLWTAAANALKPRTDATAWDTLEYSVDAGARILQRNLRTIASVAKGWGAEAVILTMPVTQSPEKHDHMRRSHLQQQAGLGPIPSYSRFHRDFALYNDSIRALGAEGVRVIDMAALLPANEDYFFDLVHYSTAGVLAFGEALAHHLAPHIRARTSNQPAPSCAWAADPVVREALLQEGLGEVLARY